MAVIAAAKGHLDPTLVMAAVGAGMLALLLLVLYPQMMFKPQERRLRIGPEGLESEIRGASAHRAWTDVTEVSERNEGICITMRSGNAFIVPERAFASPQDRGSFFESARDWWRATAA